MIENLQADERGVSEVVGAILVFGLAVMLLGIIQAQAIPAANQEVEFNHNLEVQGDIIDLQEAVSRSGQLGTRESVKVQTGTTYPSRLLFFNPDPPAGALRTEDVGLNAKITNVVAPKQAPQSQEQYIDGDIRDLETKRLTYTPNYNEYKPAPTTTLEYGVLYNQQPSGQPVIANRGSVIRENQITLTFLAGDLATAQPGSLSIDTRPTSAPARTVSVEPQNPGQPIVLTLPTKLDATQWENRILSDQMAPQGNVERVENVAGQEAVRIFLVPATYQLQMSQVGIGDDPGQNAPKYLIAEPNQNTLVGAGDPIELSFQVRDKYNNPVSNVNVDLATGPNDPVPPGSSKGLQSTTVTTDQQGRATVRYVAPTGVSSPLSFDLKASYANDPSSTAFDPNNNLEDTKVIVTIVNSRTGSTPTTSIQINSGNSQCVDTDSGAAGTTLLGSEAAEVEVDWTASMPSGSSNDLAEVKIEMVDVSNGQTADSTRYSLSSSSASDTTILRDRRRNDDSCDRDYKLKIRAVSDGGVPASDQATAQSGIDYAADPGGLPV